MNPENTAVPRLNTATTVEPHLLCSAGQPLRKELQEDPFVGSLYKDEEAVALRWLLLESQSEV